MSATQFEMPHSDRGADYQAEKWVEKNQKKTGEVRKSYAFLHKLRKIRACSFSLLLSSACFVVNGNFIL
jgi:hypothetical protein